MSGLSQAANYLRARLHRAIEQGDKSLTVSTLDLKDTLAELESLQHHRDINRSPTPLVGWADPRAIQQMHQGKIWSLSVTRKKVGARSQQICASVDETHAHTRDGQSRKHHREAR